MPFFSPKCFSKFSPPLPQIISPSPPPFSLRTPHPPRSPPNSALRCIIRPMDCTEIRHVHAHCAHTYITLCSSDEKNNYSILKQKLKKKIIMTYKFGKNLIISSPHIYTCCDEDERASCNREIKGAMKSYSHGIFLGFLFL